MRIVLAPDKFKGSLSAAEAARAMADGIARVDSNIEIDQCPMADGGEGTVEAMVAATGGTIFTFRVTGPLPRMKVDAIFGMLGDGTTAIVEMAAASGISLLAADQRDPTRTTSYGTGELLREAANRGATRIIVGLGGSATCDAGIGAAQAWGATFTLSTGTEYQEGSRRLTGGDLINLRSVESQLPLETLGIEFIGACDVDNPLLGSDGAAKIFAPQKGASPQQITQLENGLARLVDKIGRHDLSNVPGAGAAGGLGFGLRAFFNASLAPGGKIVADAIKLRERLRGADLCITGEGKFDATSLGGKTPIAVAEVCRELNVPCVVLAGEIDLPPTALAQAGISAFSVMRGRTTLASAMIDAPDLLAAAAESITRLAMQISSRRS